MFVLKNKKGEYLAQANARLRVKIVQGIPVEKTIMLDTLELIFTKDINGARGIDSPNIDAVHQHGLIAVEVEADNPKIKETGVVYDSCIN